MIDPSSCQERNVFVMLNARNVVQAHLHIDSISYSKLFKFVHKEKFEGDPSKTYIEFEQCIQLFLQNR